MLSYNNCLKEANVVFVNKVSVNSSKNKNIYITKCIFGTMVILNINSFFIINKQVFQGLSHILNKRI